MCLYSDCITLGPAVLIALIISRTARVMKCVPAHFVAIMLPHLVLSIILGFHPLKDCNTMLPLFSKGKNTCWKMFIKYAHQLE